MNIGIGGPLSSGKTATSIIWVLDLSDYGKRKKIISVIDLKGVPCKCYSPKQLTDFLYKHKENPVVLEKFFRDSVLFLDEIKNFISAKKTSSNLNETWQQFLMMAGKLDCDVVFTYQVYESQVDKEFRLITDLNFECERVTIKGRSLIQEYPLWIANQRIPKNPDGTLVPVRIKVKEMVYINEQLVPTGRFIMFDPVEIGKYYNTRELVILDRTQYLKG